jgi:hypothetical protein
MKDSLMDMVHKARAKLLEECGGMGGVFKYVKELERRHAQAMKKEKARTKRAKKMVAKKR